jgi:hypothetical protein
MDLFGKLPISSLKPFHLNKWLQAHPTWRGSKRSHIQAIKRVINFAVESGMIEANPVKGYKAPKQNARVTYITPAQEKALYEAAKPPMEMAIQVCIRTGARPGCEFAPTVIRLLRHPDLFIGFGTFFLRASSTSASRSFAMVSSGLNLAPRGIVCFPSTCAFSLQTRALLKGLCHRESSI